LGGTLAVIHAAAHEEKIASLALLAAPVRFDDDGLLSRWTKTRSFDVGALVEATGNVPWQLMQSAFHLLRPTMNLSKAVHVLDRAWDDESLDGFLALETWGNDNVSFPGACYRRYIDELYRGDALMRGTFTLSGKPARLEAITCPTLAVTFEHDHIVPWQSAAAVLDAVSSTDKERLHLSGGHVGAVVSKGAKKALWPKLAAFWQVRDAAPTVKAEAVVEEEAVVEAESVAEKAELVKAAVPAKAKAARPKPAKPKARRKGR
jgi:polyhydroxyalkanoate synthase